MRRWLAWSKVVRAGLALSVTLGSTNASAQPQPPENAGALFDRGVALAQAGDLDAAVVALEQAYALRPHSAVLYNIGLAYGAMGRPVEAVRALRQYLEEGKTALDPDRRAEVEAMIAAHERRIGTLTLEVDPPQARIEIDGVAVDGATDKVRLVAGRHVVVVAANGHSPAVVTADVPAGGRSERRVVLTAAPGPRPPVRERAWVQIECPVPDVVVELDGTRLATTPLTSPVSVERGFHTFRFSRRGYQTANRVVTASSTRITELDCAVQLEPQLRPAECGTLTVTPSEANADIWVDGARFAGQRVPIGRHWVEVQSPGFRPWAADVQVTAGRTAPVFAGLSPTPAYARRYQQRAQRERTAAYSIGGVGMALVATAIGLGIDSKHRFAEWRDEREQLDACADWTLTDKLANDAAGVQRADDWALTAAITGGALLVASAAWLLWGDDPHRYPTVARPRTNDPRVASGRWTW